MPIQIFFTKLSPENDPMFNEKARKVFMEFISKREALLKKHGIKGIGGWFVPMEHLLLVIDEAPSLDAFQKFLMEPEWMALLAYGTVETKIALSAEEATKMLRQAK
jgi:hypothetical protein